MGLSKQQRVAAKKISPLFKESSMIRGRFLVLRYIRTKDDEHSFAVIVPRSVAPLATTRNRLRRRVSEVIRVLLPKDGPGFRGVCTVSDARLPIKEEIEREALVLLKKSGIVSK